MDAEVMTFLSFSGVAINALLLAGLIVLVLRYRKLYTQTLQETRSVHDDIAAVCSAAWGVGQRLESLEDKLRRQTARLEQNTLSEAPQQSYRQALQLIDSGADIPTLVEQCGVTQGEAELLANLHYSELTSK